MSESVADAEGDPSPEIRDRIGDRPGFDELAARFPDNIPVVRDALRAGAVQREGDPVAPGNEVTPSYRSVTADEVSTLGRYRVTGRLGAGGFGIVYSAFDDELRRTVAIKVPHDRWHSLLAFADNYLTEARVVAGLDHSNIVPVYDFGRTSDGRPYVVSKFIEGRNLADWLAQARPSFDKSTTIVAAIADALHHAHLRGLVHRDIKPANILIDCAGKAYVADFGMVLQEEEFGRGPTFVGTPAYMSPEQARFEGHRVDGRSDIFSLGVVYYEMLTGRRPFHAADNENLLSQLLEVEARPPRQIDDSIPRELERICLKALSKRASDRYTTAKDMADDLRLELARETTGRNQVDRAGFSADNPPAPPPGAIVAANRPGAPPTITPAGLPSDNQAFQIVPKGLRSFDAHDADFFLELLPGPRDREGLPESIRFWKTRIEETDADNTFSVGLIYGPSGCGKTSLIQAGLLPRLSANVLVVYVEATARETEARLLNGIRKRVPGLSASDLSLTETLANLRRGQGLAPHTKVLIVLDQFEQWLHAGNDDANSELVLALRQCDGARVQCIVTVRDDFWLSVSRFLRKLEIRLIEGQNSALADLFDVAHAGKVLAALGRAFGKLPAKSSETSRDAREFLTQAISGLAQENKVVPVRLALFAEMMKGRVWTPASLKEVGGTAGVGVTFLEETFSTSTSPPGHRLHQKAARAVLTALLPESGSDIKGHMRSDSELLAASGYEAQPDDFDSLIRILDSEIRLITPTDPEGKRGPDESMSPVRERHQYYQLTHDYLVPSLRDWLTRKMKETREGRAQLRLAERAVLWSDKPGSRRLPTLWEWADIRIHSDARQWTPLQRAMMRRSDRRYVFGAVGLIAFLALLAWGVGEYHGRLKAVGLRDRLLNAATADVPEVVADMRPYRRWLNPLLRVAADEAKSADDPKKQLRVGLALLPDDRAQAPYFYERLLSAEPHEFGIIRAALAPHGADWVEPSWAESQSATVGPDRRFRAACALAGFAADDPRWRLLGSETVAKLVVENPLVLSYWIEALRPAGSHLLAPLAASLEDEGSNSALRRTAAKLYQAFAEASPDAFARLESRMADSAAPDGAGESKTTRARRQANLGAALVSMGQARKVWPLLVHTPDPTLRSFLIERLSDSTEPQNLEDRLAVERDVSARRALLLAIGGFGVDRLPPAERNRFATGLLKLYRDDPDPGIRAAAEWTLRQWGQADRLRTIDRELASSGPAASRNWFVNREGQTMVLIPGSNEPANRQGRIAFASKEVTVEEFLRFRDAHPYSQTHAPAGECPANSVSWFQAAEYCNWLSVRDGIEPDQLCYLPNNAGKFEDGMTIAPNFRERMGYRLPTEAEWVAACLAAAAMNCSFGEPDHDLVMRYARFQKNSYERPAFRSARVGTFKPNDWGLFDMHGNVFEWCHDTFGGAERVMRSSSFWQPEVGSEMRLRRASHESGESIGFRPVRGIR